jgi:hypothetical protein
MFTDPLSNNGRPFVMRVCFLGIVSTESLPSNAYTRTVIYYNNDTHLAQYRGNIQTNGAYNNNENNIATTFVGNALNNMQNTDATGRIQRQNT